MSQSNKLEQLLVRLKAFYNELKRAEMEDKQKGNDEACAATYACAERLNEVVKDFIAEHSTLPASDLCYHPSTRTSDGAIVCNVCGETLAP